MKEKRSDAALSGDRIATVTLEIKIIRMSGRAREEGWAGVFPLATTPWEISAC